jgi:uncharacterized protein
VKTRIIQDEPDDGSTHIQRPPSKETTMSRLAAWIRAHRVITFFVLAYLFAWWSWPFYGLGIAPEVAFIPAAPLLAALIVIGVAEGRAGFRDLGARIIRWRVAWYWYVVALGLPLAVRFLAAGINAGPGGAPTPHWTDLAWSSFAAAFAVRLIDPMDGPLGEEPGWRGFALPRMQSRRSPLISALVLGVLAAGWHLPLAAEENVGAVGLLTTFAITIVYVWLFNHTRGSLLLALLFHDAQGAIKSTDLGFIGADQTRYAWLECALWFAVAIGVVVLDRAAWRTPPASAVFPEPAPAPSPAAAVPAAASRTT